MYEALNERYDIMDYEYCGNSGLKLPKVSLGLWHNFGANDSFENGLEILKTAFDLGITHFDLANNYGPPGGAAEENFGKMLKSVFLKYRDELVISTKAGYKMWEGPYGDWGSKKYLISSLDQSLKRMGLEYVDIFYHHRSDPLTPLEETMRTLDLIVKQGKALYVGISNYSSEEARSAFEILKELGTPCIIHQGRYNMLDRGVEKVLEVADEYGMGFIAFSPLANGILTDRYFNGIPKDSRAGGESIFLKKEDVKGNIVEVTKKLSDIAVNREQSLAQMALSWCLRDNRVTSVLIGASKESQVEDCIKSLNNLDFTVEELKNIDDIINSK